MTEPVLQQGTTATLVGYPPADLRGSVSSATVRVHTPAASLPDSATAATLSTFDTTTDAAASRGATSISVASATGATVGRLILVGSDLVAEVASISGTTIGLRLPLPVAIASGAAVKGLDISISLSTAQTDEVGNGFALWISDNGTEWPQPFVISHRAVAWHLTSAELRKRYPIVDQLTMQRDADFADVIETAWTAGIEPQLLSAGLQPENIRSWSVLDEWHAAEVVYRLVLGSPRHSGDDVERRDTIRTNARANALDNRRFWYSETEEIGTQPDNPVGLSRISFRM